MDRAPLRPRAAAFPRPRSNDARLFDALRPVASEPPRAPRPVPVPVAAAVSAPAPAVSVAVQTAGGAAEAEGERAREREAEMLGRRAEALEARCEELRRLAQSAVPAQPRVPDALPGAAEAAALREALAAGAEENRRLSQRVTELEQALVARDRAVDELAGLLAGHAGDADALRAELEAARERAAVFEAELARVKARIARGLLGG